MAKYVRCTAFGIQDKFQSHSLEWHWTEEADGQRLRDGKLGVAVTVKREKKAN